MNGAIRITLAPLSNPDDEFTVIAGMVEARKWERKNGRGVAAALNETAASTIVELAHLAYIRRHKETLTVEEFEDRFDVLGVDGGAEVSKDPSVPATAPQPD